MTMPYNHFNKEEMVKLAQELGIQASLTQTVVELARNIHGNLITEGIPAEEDCSELLDEYLFTLGYIDEDGAVIDPYPVLTFGDEWKDANEDTGVEIITAEEDTSDVALSVVEDGDSIIVDGKKYTKPDCFTRAEERDPACRKCPVFKLCLEQRIKLRPPCFGKLYQANHEECKACLERLPCSTVVSQKQLRVL